MKILLLNAGSSSLKSALMDADGSKVLASALADWAGSETRYEYTGPDGKMREEGVAWKGHARAVARFLDDLREIAPAALTDLKELSAVGHRVVHGGEFSAPVQLTPEIRARINALSDLAPLHNPPSLETLAAAEEQLRHIPQVAVFDTAFHATIPPHAYTYAVPYQWTKEWGIRRFGFHGLSHSYCSGRAAELLGRPIEELRLVVCHLGHGCSATAVNAGRSVDTTMGFTPLEGLVMGTRSGTIDPSIALLVQERKGYAPDEVERILNRESGLLGVSGVSGDMRKVLDAAAGGNEQAQLALDIYAHKVRQAIGSLTVAMNGLDAVVFTAGVGEHSAPVRRQICAGLECLGLELDGQANASCRPDSDIAKKSSRARILVIATREDITMLREVVKVVTGKANG